MYYLYVYIVMELGWEVRDLKKFMCSQFGPSFWDEHKNYIRTVGITKDAFLIDKPELSDCLYSRLLTNEKKMPRFIIWKVSEILI